MMLMVFYLLCEFQLKNRNHSEEACFGHGACGSAAKVTKVNQSK